MELISVIIVNWNGKRLLAECLESLRRQQFKQFLTILVDNGSTDGSVEFVRHAFPEIRMVRLEENLGFAIANNVAIRETNTKYVALLNNDTVAHPLWLKSLYQALETRPEAGFAASKMILYNNKSIIDRAGDAYSTAGTGLLRGRGIQVEAYKKQEWIFGACAAAALYRKAMLEDIGLFDEDFFLLYEDVDLSFRAQLRNHKCLYVPEAIVYHKASSSIVHDSAISVYYSHRNLEWVYVKNMPFRLIVKTILPHIIYDFSALCYFAATGMIGEFVRAKWDALRGLQHFLDKRHQMQVRQTANDEYLWNLLERERFWPRLHLRFGKKGDKKK